MQVMRKLFFMVLFVLTPTCAMAYVGPGLGAGTVGVVFGVIGSVFIALFAVAWYPLKRMLKKFQRIAIKG